MSAITECYYKEVDTVPEEVGLENVEKGNELTWRLLVRQIMVCSAIWSSSFTQGLSIGAPTVIIPQIRLEANSTDIISQETASWLSSAVIYSATLLVILLTILSKFYGRKTCFLLTSIVGMLGFLILYFSKNVTHLFIGEFFQGILSACPLTISILVVTEYSCPRYRGIFLTIKCASFLWGLWVSNIIGTFFHYKYIAVVGCVATVYNITAILISPESPYWLASKGRFEECRIAHRWLKGNGDESIRELKNLIDRQTNVIQGRRLKFCKHFFRDFYKTITCKSFYTPALPSLLIITLYHSLGKMVCAVYAIDIIKKMTGNETTAYSGMLILDGITVLGMYTGCGISKFVRRRPLLFVTSALGILSLLCLSLYMFLVKQYIINENTYISLILLIVYSLSVSCGPMILSTSIMGELVPITFRNSFTFLMSAYGTFVMASFIKISPFLFSTLGFSGSFLIFAILASICLLILYLSLPETKDKTLFEIENLLLNPKKKSKRTVREGTEIYNCN